MWYMYLLQELTWRLFEATYILTPGHIMNLRDPITLRSANRIQKAALCWGLSEIHSDRAVTIRLPVVGSTWQESINWKPLPTTSTWTFMYWDLSKSCKIYWDTLPEGKECKVSIWLSQGMPVIPEGLYGSPFLFWYLGGPGLPTDLWFRSQTSDLQEQIWLAADPAQGHINWNDL